MEVDCHFIREKIQKAVLLSSFQDEPDEYIRFILRGSIEFVIGYGYRCLCYKAFVNIELSYSSLV